MSERKRQKITTTDTLFSLNTATKFEALSNELILFCFNYFDFYQLCKTFSCLNQRFNQLITNHARIYIDLSSVPTEKFLTLCFQMHQFLTTRTNYPLSIQADDEQKFSLLLNDDLLIDKFSKLKSLSVGCMKADIVFDAIFGEERKLYETLERLNLMYEISGEKQAVDQLCQYLMSSKMKSLKYLNLNFEPYSCGCDQGLNLREDYVSLQFEQFSVTEKSISHLETLIIGCIPDDQDDDETTTTMKISFNELIHNVLPYLPNLKNLMINAIDFKKQNLNLMPAITTDTKSDLSLNLRVIKLWIDVNRYAGKDEKRNKEILRKYFMKTKSSSTSTLKTFYINNENILKKKF